MQISVSSKHPQPILLHGVTIRSLCSSGEHTSKMAEIATVAFQLTLTWYTWYVLFCFVLNNSQPRIYNPPYTCDHFLLIFQNITKELKNIRNRMSTRNYKLSRHSKPAKMAWKDDARSAFHFSTNLAPPIWKPVFYQSWVNIGHSWPSPFVLVSTHTHTQFA